MVENFKSLNSIFLSVFIFKHILTFLLKLKDLYFHENNFLNFYHFYLPNKAKWSWFCFMPVQCEYFFLFNIG